MKKIEIIGFPNYTVSEDGIVKNSRRMTLKPYLNSQTGYRVVVLVPNKHRPIHRLIAEHFIPNPEGKLQVNHKDGDKLNNAIDNLEWCTHHENMTHAANNGLTGKGKARPSFRGENHTRAKLTENQVKNIKRLIQEGARVVDMSREFGVAENVISHIKAGTSWKHIEI